MRTLVISLSVGGAGAAASVLLSHIGAGRSLSLALLSICLLSASIYSLVAAPSTRLFSFRYVDVLWGLGLAVLLRFSGGLLARANSAPFPVITEPSVAAWMEEVVLPAGVIGPLVEELYFRAFMTVVVFRLLIGVAGRLAATITAVSLSAGGFLVLHAVFSPLRLVDAALLLALGTACSLLVILTGRIWGAILLHISYNATFLALAAFGTLLS